MIKYRLFEEIRVFDGVGTKTFGIAAFDDNGDIVGVAPNITSVREKAERLLEKCTMLDVSPCHLVDVAEDFVISDDY